MDTCRLTASVVLFGGLLTVAVQAVPTVYTDETSYLSALSAGGYGPLVEGFEGAAWDGVRTTIGGVQSAPSVTSQGITWTSTDEVTTSSGAARSGNWGGYDQPGGDPDILFGQSAFTLYGIGGWFRTNTPTTNIQLYLGGVMIDNGSLTLGTAYSFIGIIEPAGFTTFEIRDTEAVPEDQKHWFSDDYTFAVAPASNIPAASAWTFAMLILLVITAGTIVLRNGVEGKSERI